MARVPTPHSKKGGSDLLRRSQLIPVAGSQRFLVIFLFAQQNLQVLDPLISQKLLGFQTRKPKSNTNQSLHVTGLASGILHH